MNVRALLLVLTLAATTASAQAIRVNGGGGGVGPATDGQVAIFNGTSNVDGSTTFYVDYNTLLPGAALLYFYDLASLDTYVTFGALDGTAIITNDANSTANNTFSSITSSTTSANSIGLNSFDTSFAAGTQCLGEACADASGLFGTGGRMYIGNQGDFDVHLGSNNVVRCTIAAAGPMTCTSAINIQASGSTFGSTSANLLTSNVVATGGTDTAWLLNTGALANFTDHAFVVKINGTDAFQLTAPGQGRFASNLIVEGGSIGTLNAVSSINNVRSSAGVNAAVQNGSNAAGEIAFVVGTNDTTTAQTNFAIANDIDGTTSYVQTVKGNGHETWTGGVPGNFTTGTCTSDSGVGDDSHGTLTGTCTAQTLIVPFSATRTAAPYCVVSPTNAAAWASVAGIAYATTTAALTITVTTATVAGTWTYICIE